MNLAFLSHARLPSCCVLLCWKLMPIFLSWAVWIDRMSTFHYIRTNSTTFIDAHVQGKLGGQPTVLSVITIIAEVQRGKNVTTTLQ